MKRSLFLQKPRVIAGHGFVQTSSPTSPRTGFPSASKTSTAMPSAGEPSEQLLVGTTGHCPRKHAPISVPPAMLMIGMRPPPAASENHLYGSGFQGSPVEARMRNRETSCLLTSASPAGMSARINVGDTPRI